MLGEIREEMRRTRLEQAEIREELGDVHIALEEMRAADIARDHAGGVPVKLAAAMRAGHRDGKGLVLPVGDEEIIVVVGDENPDPAPVWDFLLHSRAS
jgi:hypothetical protein